MLLVEEDPETASTIRGLLGALGVVDITVAHNGVAVWSIFEAGRLFDLVISDWMKPERNGLQVLKNIRAHHPRIPFLMLTGSDRRPAAEAAQAGGADAVLCKPFRPAEFVACVLALLPEGPCNNDGELEF